MASSSSLKALRKILAEDEEVLKGKQDLVTLLQGKLREKTRKMAPKLESVRRLILEEMNRVRRGLDEKEKELVAAAEKMFLVVDERESEALVKGLNQRASMQEDILGRLRELERQGEASSDNLQLFIKFSEYKTFLKQDLETLLESILQRSTQSHHEMQSLVEMDRERFLEQELEGRFERLRKEIAELSLEAQAWRSDHTDYENNEDQKIPSSVMAKSSGFARTPEPVASFKNYEKSNGSPIYVFSNLSPNSEAQKSLGVRDIREKIKEERIKFKKSEEEFFSKGQARAGNQLDGYQHFVKNGYGRSQNIAESQTNRTSTSSALKFSQDSQEVYQDTEESFRDRTYRRKLDNLDKVMKEIMNSKSSGWSHGSAHQRNLLNSSIQRMAAASPERIRPNYSQYLLGRTPRNSLPIASHSPFENASISHSVSYLERSKAGSNVFDSANQGFIGLNSHSGKAGKFIFASRSSTPSPAEANNYLFKKKDLKFKGEDLGKNSSIFSTLSSRLSTPKSIITSYQDIDRILLTPSRTTSSAIGRRFHSTSKNDPLLKQRELFEKRKTEFIFSS